MKKNICVTAFLVIVVVFFEPANALDLRIQPRFKTGIQFYEFEQEAFQFPARDPQGKYPNKQSRLAYSDWLPFVSGGATLFIDRFFVDFDAQYLFDGEAGSDFISQTYIKGAGGGLSPDVLLQNNSQLDADFDRFEWAISAGFEVIDNLVIFGGYKHAKTSHTSNIHGSMETFFVGNGSEIAIPFLSGTTMGEVDIEFEYDGPFVGMNYIWKINKGFMNGGLSFNFAAAFLDSHTELDLSKISVKSATGEVTPLTFQDGDRQAEFKALEGDSTGYSFGVGWQGLTSAKGLTYLMGVTGYRYEFDGSETIENRVRLDFGLAYAFDF